MVCLTNMLMVIPVSFLWFNFRKHSFQIIVNDVYMIGSFMYAYYLSTEWLAVLLKYIPVPPLQCKFSKFLYNI